MDILVCAATEEEVSPLREIWFRKHNMDYLVSGVGMVATTHALTKRLSEKHYDLAVNTGLAGAFTRSIQIGEVVRVTEDIFSELGAEDDDRFLSLKEIGLSGTDTFINLDEHLPKDPFPYRKVRSITVNTIHGNEKSIETVIKRFKPDIETMEGAAFFFVCGVEKIPCIQIRSISNYVEKRNRDAWNIPLALQNLKQELSIVLEKI
ncbi:MAG: futalosine hydrolase [Bacteroidetes bacterium]|nr:MAG: futalosine hydrolase [Bacteroidota bacterium]REK05113.1 MAG: futalosine hydrolase [Bacteroidota bacterium]REK32518.1 MAG: futalosine hydrolase [Bacteroidota bacterium]REK49035.1 MAG: futalosine hydrolase [Bacteroidota bacterium]